jgi:hypothetical protein
VTASGANGCVLAVFARSNPSITRIRVGVLLLIFSHDFERPAR